MCAHLFTRSDSDSDSLSQQIKTNRMMTLVYYTDFLGGSGSELGTSGKGEVEVDLPRTMTSKRMMPGAVPEGDYYRRAAQLTSTISKPPQLVIHIITVIGTNFKACQLPLSVVRWRTMLSDSHMRCSTQTSVPD